MRNCPAIFASFFLSLVLTGCASIGPPLPPSLQLPHPPTDLHASRKGNKVTLTWTIPTRTMQRQTIRYMGKTQVCREIGVAPKPPKPPQNISPDQPYPMRTGRECTNIIGDVSAPHNLPAENPTAAQKINATYDDQIPDSTLDANSAQFATYAVEVLNTDNRGGGLSNEVRVSLVPTLAPFASFNAQTTPPGVLISWACPSASVVHAGVKYLFRIYRRRQDSKFSSKLTDVDADACAAAQSNAVTSFLDQTFSWESTYFYRGNVVSMSTASGPQSVEVEGDDTPEVQVVAHDVFPPAVPTGVQAVFSGPDQQTGIDLVWSPVSAADLAGYNVYRRETGTAAVKVNSDLIKTSAFRDTQTTSGKTYFYSVSAVDERGNESSRSAEASETVP